MSTMSRFIAAAAIAGSALLSGCAALNTIGSDVASYGSWPTDRKPGSYSFDRLPSQQQNPQRQDVLEAAAAQALQAAGFWPAAEGTKGDVTVQVGARIDRYESYPWADPFWWPGVYPYYAGWGRPWGPYWGSYWGPYWGPRYGYGMGPYCCGFYGSYYGYYGYDYYDREVALLIRDAADGKPLYETRATSSGGTSGSERLLAAMFHAAMTDFPHTNDRLHSVSIEMQPAH